MMLSNGSNALRFPFVRSHGNTMTVVQPNNMDVRGIEHETFSDGDANHSDMWLWVYA